MLTNKLFFMLCCFALVGGLAVAGCGDDGGNTDNDTTTTDTTTTDTTTTDTNVIPDVQDDSTTNNTDTTPDSDAVTACEPAVCAADGKVCGTDGTCVDDVTGCQAANESCDLTAAQPEGWVCADDTTGAGFCAPSCTTATGTDSCTPGSVCIEDTPGAGGFCLEGDCSNFFAATTDCGTGSNCIPVGNATSFCFAAGVAAEGEACESFGDCNAGLLCMGTCEVPDCTALTTTKACTGGQLCSGLTLGEEAIDLGFCIQTCDPFATTTTCGATEQCIPSQRNASGGIDGICTDSYGPYGTAVAGDNCSPTYTAVEAACDEGLFCLRVTDTESQCRPLCDPNATTGAGACGTSETCFQLSYSDGTETDFGICETTCNPWGDSSDCPNGEACFPTLIEDVGQCDTAGTLAADATCGTDAFGQCGGGTMCLLTDVTETPCTVANAATVCGADSFCDPNDLVCLTAKCTTLCDPRSTAGSGATGACDATFGCIPLAERDPVTGDLNLYPIGTCDEACDYNSTACTDTTKTCFNAWGFGWDLPFDFCMAGSDVFNPALLCVKADGTTHAPPCAELEGCSGIADPFGESCNGGGACLDLPGITSGNQCVEFCDGSNNGCGITNHPMCSRTTATCSCMFSDPTFGICGQDG